ncbi:MAG: tetratricopeptide repeat protein [Campylobacterales bacterium]|nr:tetratricopeptide repeat protein [Campylobacterales bacterium]
MRNGILVAIIATITYTNLIATEPSAFGAGNLDNPTPYEITSSEKIVSDNQNNLQKVVAKNNNQGSEIDSLRERIDGLQSIIESLSKKAQSNKSEINILNQKNSAESKSSDEFYKRLSDISHANSEDIAKIKVVISELAKAIEVMNKSQVSKSELTDKDKASSKKSENKEKTDNAKSTDKFANTEKSELESMSNEDVDTKAKEFFDKKNYTKSSEYYNHLVDKNYKPAVSHYMMGEINFKRKNYSEAVAYYKKSSSLYAKASYMPSLLLHTAISMDSTNDKKNAKMFYEGLIAKYPESNEAKEAKKYLTSMK